ncbi:MAG: heme ABC exporter ATP-binding protein CcmA [Rhodospirillales bacterium]|nr:heme ABC exporter ATP-binding protein CcmA [Rhodospirillales bacterium]
MTNFSGHNLTCLRGERLVFKGLDFSIEAGDALVLIGPNGSGKSSLLRMLAGLLKPYGGDMTWDSESVGEEPEQHRGRLHYVGHHDCVKAVLTVEENLTFWARMHDKNVDAEAKVASALDTLSISHLADVPGRFLSAGQKRRANLARIMAADAPLWLLDEPITALDKESITKLERTMADHRQNGGMIVLSTHSEITLENPKILDLADFAIGFGEGFYDDDEEDLVF